MNNGTDPRTPSAEKRPQPPRAEDRVPGPTTAEAKTAPQAGAFTSTAQATPSFTAAPAAAPSYAYPPPGYVLTPIEVSSTGQAAGRATDQMLDQANHVGDQGMSSLGKGAFALAANIRAQGRRMDVDPRALEQMAQPIDAAGRYLVHANPKQMASDVDGTVKAHPYKAMLAGAAIGWFVGRFISR